MAHSFRESCRCVILWRAPQYYQYSDMANVHFIGDLTVPCCDICSPPLLDRTRPGPKPVSKRQKNVKKGLPDRKAQRQLEDWRDNLFERDYKGAHFDPEALLPDTVLDAVVCFPPAFVASDSLEHYLTSGKSPSDLYPGDHSRPARPRDPTPPFWTASDRH